MISFDLLRLILDSFVKLLFMVFHHLVDPLLVNTFHLSSSTFQTFVPVLILDPLALDFGLELANLLLEFVLLRLLLILLVDALLFNCCL